MEIKNNTKNQRNVGSKHYKSFKSGLITFHFNYN